MRRGPVARHAVRKQFEEELLKEDWTRVRPKVRFRKLAVPQGDEIYILCRTWGRKRKRKQPEIEFTSMRTPASCNLDFVPNVFH